MSRRAPRAREGGEKVTDVDERKVALAVSLFFDAAEAIWGLPVVAKLNVDVEVENIRTLAALRFAHMPRSIGNRLVRLAPRYELVLAPRLLEQSDEVIKRIMVHEAVHIGYPRHTKEFFDVCDAFGGSKSEMNAFGAGYEVQRKEGARYQTIASFETEKEAVAFAKAQQREHPGKYRLIF